MSPCQLSQFPNFPGRNNALKPLCGITGFYGAPFEEYPYRSLKARINPACLRLLEIFASQAFFCSSPVLSSFGPKGSLDGWRLKDR